MNELEFDKRHVAPILEGRKEATVRMDKECPDPGCMVEAVTESGARITVLEIKQSAKVMAVEALEFMNLVGAGYGADDPDELMDGLERYYDGVRPGAYVTVITFETVES